MQQRLFEITYLLTAKGSITAGELAQRFGVSRRTIYRDIDALSSSGIPVYTEKGKGGGIRLMPGFVLDKSLFSTEEKSQLLSHLQTLSAFDMPHAQTTVDKVSALFGATDTWLKIDFSPWGSDSKIRILFYQIKNAILRRTILTFSYTGSNGIKQQREVEPYLIVFKGSGWYLHGYCTSRQDFRFFKLARMQEATFQNSIFSPRNLPEQSEEAMTFGNLMHFQLKVDASQAFRVYDEFPTEEIEVLADGNFLITANYPDSDWLCGYVLSFGGSAEVISPTALRQNIAAILQETIKRYAL